MILFILPTPHTPHPTPHTPHPTPYTLHPTPHTLHPTPHHPRAMFTGIKLVKRDTKLLELPKTSI
ncbi:MAG: hypothetical protein EWV57_12940 [Microcystis aeruginosa Ma_QC_Ch_20071001_S25D]|uniref:Uncharacterized protein n=1 Tax=Microcystis aeruginosa Ma_QC_Ch_20071001_S25D TaxID=2486250 RepID=A0A552FR24_MICAE|nr:MAG: hypothetical protein EWV57_12940 [Microcystis aeruginosa Ma_QC_Ch_20071001_S25D]TRU56957.1 MAG: hypothetical protein EWV90_21705 [Microcystis aeruginosa Ma_QC_Ch_20071001_M135]